MPQATGYKLKPYKFKDHSHKALFGGATPELIVPLNRDVSGIPIVYQGSVNSCVSCSVTWVKSYLEKEHPTLSWQWLARISGTQKDGAAPGDVLEAARKQGIGLDSIGTDAEKHKVGGYYYVNCNPTEMYAALKKSVLAIGVLNFQGVGPHFLVAVDVNDKGQFLCENWWKDTVQDQVLVDMKDVVECVGFGDTTEAQNPRFSFFEVLKDKVSFLPIKRIIAAFLALISTMFTQPATQTVVQQQTYGSAGVYDKYAPTISGSGIQATDVFIPFSTFTLSDGSSVATSSIKFPSYWIINPNSSSDREKVECNGLDQVNKRLIYCYRAISCNNLTNSTSTVSGGAYAHPAGETVIMSNDNCFFNRFVDNSTIQMNIAGEKGFTNASTSFGGSTGGLVWNTGSAKLGWTDDGVSTFTFASGSSGLTASSTKGIFVTASQIGINASTTQGLKFDSNGFLQISASSTSSTNGGFLTFNSIGQLYWNVTQLLQNAWTWTAAQVFNAGITVNGASTSTASFQQTIAPVSGNDITNKTYVDNAVVFGQATGTAQVAITAGNALWLSATSSQLMLTNTSAPSSTFQFVGFASQSATFGSTVSFTKPGGINCNQSGLTSGTNYYLSGSGGAIATTSGSSTASARVGVALSSSCIEVLPPKYVLTGTVGLGAVGTTTTYVGFYPAHIDLRVGCNSAMTTGFGFSTGDESNRSIGYGNDGSNNRGGADNANAWDVYCASTVNGSGTITNRNQFGFTLNALFGLNNTPLTAQYTAFSE